MIFRVLIELFGIRIVGVGSPGKENIDQSLRLRNSGRILVSEPTISDFLDPSIVTSSLSYKRAT